MRTRCTVHREAAYGEAYLVNEYDAACQRICAEITVPATPTDVLRRADQPGMRSLREKIDTRPTRADGRVVIAVRVTVGHAPGVPAAWAPPGRRVGPGGVGLWAVGCLPGGSGEGGSDDGGRMPGETGAGGG